MYGIQDSDEICDLCSRKNNGENLRYFQNFLPNPRVVVALCIRCSLKAWVILAFFHVIDDKPKEIKQRKKRKYKKRMGKGTGMKLKGRKKPTDLYCFNCLEETVSLENSDHLNKLYRCESCVTTYTRGQVLTFDEMTRVKFIRAKHKGAKR